MLHLAYGGMYWRRRQVPLTLASTVAQRRRIPAAISHAEWLEHDGYNVYGLVV